jgi:hypothetical protein
VIDLFASTTALVRPPTLLVPSAAGAFIAKKKPWVAMCRTLRPALLALTALSVAPLPISRSTDCAVNRHPPESPPSSNGLGLARVPGSAAVHRPEADALETCATERPGIGGGDIRDRLRGEPGE